MSSDKYNNISFLVDEDPPSGHLQRFEKKLDRELHRSAFIFEFRYIAVAVSIIILITSGILLIYNNQNNRPSKLLLAGYSPDLAEAEKYYNNILRNKLKTINAQDRMDSELSFEIKELNQALKTIYSDMKINPGDERLIDAFFGAYQTHIDVLDVIIEQYN
jgi:hypothetical protein